MADLHIGLKNFNRDMTKEHKYILGQLLRIASEEIPDAVVIAGDVYDTTTPKPGEFALFDWFLSGLREAAPMAVIMVISGNHDGGLGLNVFNGNRPKKNVYMVGTPPMHRGEHIEKVTLKDSFGNVDFYLLPYVAPDMTAELSFADGDENAISCDSTVRMLIERENIDVTKRNILVSHQFYYPVKDNEEESAKTDGIRGDILEKFDYGALGHMHTPMTVGSEAYRYPGPPMACEANEIGRPRGVILVEMQEKGSIRQRIIPLAELSL